MRIVCALLMGAAAVLLAPAGARAEDYPTKPLRLIVPFPPGGINDVVGRIVAMHLGERLGKQVIVDNRSGAGGVLGTELAANAPKDGYTLMITSLASAVNPWLYKLPYEPVKAFDPVAILVTAPTLVAVYPGLPVNSIKELIALAKAKPGELQYASSGIGTSLHLSGELFKRVAGIDMVHVPFRGAGPAMIDVMGGHTTVVFGSVTSSIGHVRTGKLRALGVGAETRSEALPEVPTVAEAGLPGYDSGNWIGVVAPAGMPPDILARLQREVAAIRELPEVRKQFAAEGAEIVRMEPAAFGTFMASELVKWGRVVKDAGIKAQ